MNRKYKIKNINIVGSKNPNYKHGKNCLNKRCQECGRILSQASSNLCRSCSRKGFRNPMYGRIFLNRKWSQEVKDKIRKALKGRKLPEKVKQKIRRFYKNPKNHPCYIDGSSFKPYTSDFSNSLKRKILQRDNFYCQLCGITQFYHYQKYHQQLNIHHIDYNKINCKKTNLITLCKSCNCKVNFNRNYWKVILQEIFRG